MISATPTKREKEVLGLIANELTSKEIAQTLYISKDTVESHRKSLLIKFDAKNAAGLIRRAFEERYLVVS